MTGKTMKCAAASLVMSSALLASNANAVFMYNVAGPDEASAIAGEQAFLGMLQSGSLVQEGFEGTLAGTQQTAFTTSVGTFTGVTPGFDSGSGGGSGACDDMGYSCAGGLAVLNDATTPFSGRFAAPEGAENNNWLDSMDYDVMRFDVIGGKNAIGFFMTDPNDQGGRMDVGLSSGESHSLDLIDIFGGKESNQSVFYLSFWSEYDFTSLVFTANNKNDGYGIDNVTVARVPEPATLGLLGAGLLGLGMAARRRSAMNG